MSWTPPTPAEVLARGARVDVALNDSEAEFYSEMARGFVSAHNSIEAWYEAARPQLPERPWTRPAAADNPLNAWYVTGSVTEGAGTLSDLSWVVKSNIAVAGWPMSAGSSLVEGYRPSADASSVKQILRAGAHLRGSANSEDLGLSGASHTSALGPVRNPWRVSHGTFGSSSGCAALVASGAVDFALGADQAGSVRLPGSGTGLVAHKPTRGRVPYSGAMPFTVVQDSLGVLSRDVHTVARVIDVISTDDELDLRQAGRDPRLSVVPSLEEGIEGIRIGLLNESFGIPNLSEPAVDRAVRAAVYSLTDHGAEVVEVSIPDHARAADLALVLSLKAGAVDLLTGNGGSVQTSLSGDPDLVTHFARNRQARPRDLSTIVALSATAGAHNGAREEGWYLAAAMRLIGALTLSYDEALQDVDLLVMPTSPYRPRPLPAPNSARGVWIGSALDMIVNTCAANLTGHPATQVPAGLVDGLPVGLQFVSRRGYDSLCLRAARAMECATGGFPHVPAVSLPGRPSHDARS